MNHKHRKQRSTGLVPMRLRAEPPISKQLFISCYWQSGDRGLIGRGSPCTPASSSPWRCRRPGRPPGSTRRGPSRGPCPAGPAPPDPAADPPCTSPHAQPPMEGYPAETEAAATGSIILQSFALGTHSFCFWATAKASGTFARSICTLFLLEFVYGSLSNCTGGKKAGDVISCMRS